MLQRLTAPIKPKAGDLQQKSWLHKELQRKKREKETGQGTENRDQSRRVRNTTLTRLCGLIQLNDCRTSQSKIMSINLRFSTRFWNLADRIHSDSAKRASVGSQMGSKSSQRCWMRLRLGVCADTTNLPPSLQHIIV